MIRFPVLLLSVAACASGTRSTIAQQNLPCPVPPPRVALVVHTMDGADREIVGVVRSSGDYTGRIGFRARVVLRSGEQIIAPADTLTNRFLLRDVPPGRHQLLIQSMGFYPRRDSIDMPAHGTLTLDVALDHSPAHWCEQPLVVPREYAG